ncbi:MAG TPA: galactitol-1-phosphate 5-dehydrogenase [Clostridiales bacterium]|nr:galactitol-1-phosphate 5-dehydrogenase [Clostridiales bacterium]
MKALVLDAYHELNYREVPEPSCGDDEVLVQVKACAICGSDVHGLDGSTGRRIPPVIMGHEAAGVIIKAGSRVRGYAPGDRVTFDSTIYCGECRFCRAGQVNLCDNRKVLGVSCGEYRLNGAFADLVAVPARILYPIPEGVSFEQAAMVEPLSIAFHAFRRACATVDTNAVVVGAGMIGLLILRLLKIAGCKRIIAVDPMPEKRAMAAQFGADSCLDPDHTDIAEEVRIQTGGFGADLAFEAVGLSATVQTGIACLRKGGQLVLVGNVKPQVEIPLQVVVTRQITLSGSCASAGEYPECLELIAQGRVDVDALISGTPPMSEGAAWFKRLYDREPGLMKVILRPEYTGRNTDNGGNRSW